VEIRKQLVVLQKKVQSLESENLTLRQRLEEVEALKDKDSVQKYKAENKIGDLLHMNGEGSSKTSAESVQLYPPPIPPRTQDKRDTSPLSSASDINVPVVGTKLENLVLDELDDDFDPRSESATTSVTNGINDNHNNNFSNNSFPIINPPPSTNGTRRTPDTSNKDLFGANPFNPVVATATHTSTDPFGMGNFGETSPNEEQKDSDTLLLDKRFSEMLDGFSRGLSFGNDDFSLESLDPLHKTS